MDEAGAGPVTHHSGGHELACLGGNQRVQVSLAHDGCDALARQEAGGHVVAREAQRRPLHLRVREGERNAEQGFGLGALHGPEAVTQDPQHSQGIRLRPHERALAAARKQLQVEATGLGEGGQLSDRQGHGRPNGRGHEGTEDYLAGLGLVKGHGKQAQGARVPAGARGGQVGDEHIEESIDEAIPVDESLIDAGLERARPTGRQPRTHGGRTVGGGQRHAAVAFLTEYPPHQLLAQLLIGAHEGQLQPGFEADERGQVPLVMLEGQVTVQLSQAQEADAVQPRAGQPGTHA